MLAACCLWRACQCILQGAKCRKDADSALDYADIVAGMKGRRLGYVASDALDIDPTDRKRVIYMSWEVSPGTVTPISPGGAASWRGPIVGPAGATPDAEDGYERNGFFVVARNESAVLRSRVVVDAHPREEHAQRDFSCLGFVGALASVGLLGMVWYCLHPGKSPSPVSVVLGVAVFVMLSSAALRYGLTSPNGLATYGGKAKLFLLSHGVPHGFFSDPAYAVYQPSYPPGMVLPPLVAFAVGGCGTAWIQLFVPFVLALLFVELVPKPTLASIALAAAYVLCPVAQQLAIGFYAEPLCALLMALGCGNLRSGRSSLGWAVVGLAGIVRPEGLLLAMILWMVMSLTERRWRWLDFVMVFSPGAMWQFMVAIAGARLQGFNFSGRPSLGVIVKAAQVVVGHHALDFEVGGVVWMALMFVLSRSCRRGGAGLLAFAGAVASGIVLVAFTASRHVDWIVETVFDRYLWLSCAVLMCFAKADSRTSGSFSASKKLIFPL